MIGEKISEIGGEFRGVMMGSGSVADFIIPPTVYVLLNATLGFTYAVWGALVLGVGIFMLRLAKHQPLRYAMGGLGGIVLAVVVARLMGRVEGYFLPGMISGAGTILIATISVLIGRPMVAWTSYIARRWPLNWYWHPRVRPAYSEVTALWVVFFALRSIVQFAIFQTQAVEMIALTNFVTGWPATIAILVVSYLYGTWRLGALKGPSVEEFNMGVEPPWSGQRRGF